MVTRIIPHEEWADFLDELGDQDEGMTVTVEVLGGAVGTQVVARGLRLQGLTLVEKGSGAGEIEIMLGEAPEEHLSHVVAVPTRLSVVETEEGEPQTLQIEADGEPTTLVHFHSAAGAGLLEEDDEEEE